MLKYFDKLERKATKQVLLIVSTILELVFPKFKRTTKAEKMIYTIYSYSLVISGFILFVVGLKNIIRGY